MLSIDAYTFFLPVFLVGFGIKLVSLLIPCLLVSIFTPCLGYLLGVSLLVTAPAATPAFGAGTVPVPSSFLNLSDTNLYPVRLRLLALTFHV